jgi:hypothetical protein
MATAGVGASNIAAAEVDPGLEPAVEMTEHQDE